MPIATAPALSMSDEQRRGLEVMARSSLPHRKVVQARALLLAADGVPNEEIARRSETTSDSVRRWRARFAESGVEGVGVIAPGRGRKPSVSDAVVEAIVHDTLHERPEDGSTQWTTRSMAQRHGVSKDMVARIWKARNLKPWRVETFKLSNDPDFEDKLVDIVGLYLHPPERAVVLCVDEKTQTQALDRTQPSLPMKPGRAGTMTHDYKRHGTTDLFAALNVATGEVLTECRRRHTHEDFLAFLKVIDRQVPKLNRTGRTGPDGRGRSRGFQRAGEEGDLRGDTRAGHATTTWLPQCVALSWADLYVTLRAPRIEGRTIVST